MSLSYRIFSAINQLTADAQKELFRAAVTDQYDWRTASGLLKLEQNNPINDARTLYGFMNMQQVAAPHLNTINAFLERSTSASGEDAKICETLKKLPRAQQHQQAQTTLSKVTSESGREQINKIVANNNDFILTVVIFTYSYILKIYQDLACLTDQQINAITNLAEAKQNVPPSLKSVFNDFNEVRANLLTTIKKEDRDFFNHVVSSVAESEVKFAAKFNKRMIFLSQLKAKVDDAKYDNTKRNFKLWLEEPADGIVALRAILEKLPVMPIPIFDSLFSGQHKGESLGADFARTIETLMADVKKEIDTRLTTNKWLRKDIVTELYQDARQQANAAAALETDRVASIEHKHS